MHQARATGAATPRVSRSAPAAPRQRVPTAASRDTGSSDTGHRDTGHRDTGHRDTGLDAIRALAILLVLAAHSHPFFAFGPTGSLLASFAGTMGVEVFFSLSGFLIGRILLAHEGQDFGWRAISRFLARRWLRTLPLYYVFLAVLFVAGWNLALHDVLLLQGFVPAIAWHLPHAWSLGVEEAFYLSLPLLVAGLGAGRHSVARAACVALLIGWTLRLGAYYGANPTGAALEWFRTNPIYRIDACALGVLVACLLKPRPGAAPWAPTASLRIALVATAMLIAAAIGTAVVVMFSLDASHGPIITTLVALYHLGMLQALNLAAALAIAGVLGLWMQPRAAARTSLIARAVATTSRLSYGLYLIHLPLFTVIGNHAAGQPWSGAPAYAVSLAATLLLAALAWRFVEAPCLAWRDRHVPASPKPARAEPATLLATPAESFTR